MNYTIICLQDDGLDPFHYIFIPGMFNDSLYKSSRAELKLMTNMDEYLMIENANNPQHSDYESSAMTQYMPTEILGKVTPEKIPDIQSIVSDAEIGYTLEVDLEIPVHLHDFFTDYPLASEKQIVSENWLSLYDKRLVKDKEVGNEKYVSGEKLSLWMKDYIEKNICKRKIAKANGDEFGVMYYK
ncbi:2462_t:CDS:2, partial [Funneliformis mosseae]